MMSNLCNWTAQVSIKYCVKIRVGSKRRKQGYDTYRSLLGDGGQSPCLITQYRRDEKQGIGDKQRHWHGFLHELDPGVGIFIHLKGVVDGTQKPERRGRNHQAVCMIRHICNIYWVELSQRNLKFAQCLKDKVSFFTRKWRNSILFVYKNSHRPKAHELQNSSSATISEASISSKISPQTPVNT